MRRPQTSRETPTAGGLEQLTPGCADWRDVYSTDAVNLSVWIARPMTILSAAVGSQFVAIE
jgi:hypothetical protein